MMVGRCYAINVRTHKKEHVIARPQAVAIPWIFRLLNWCVLLSTGLPRRFAPRNDVHVFTQSTNGIRLMMKYCCAI